MCSSPAGGPPGATPPPVGAARVRVATSDDVPAVRRLIDSSVRGLSVGAYTTAQVESALRHVFGVDSRIIADGTYYVAEEEPGAIVAAGGWSRRRTRFGGDQMRTDDDPELDPGQGDAARIRAFFVHPSRARRGLGRELFAVCCAAARAAGFRELTLVATLPGEPLYAALGFVVRERFALALPDGVELPLATMTRPVERAAAAAIGG